MATIWSQLTPASPDTLTHDCVLYPIKDQQALAITGPDSSKFMQGQFTCNLSDITLEKFRFGACCNAKGRMVASFQLMQHAEQEYVLSLHASLSETLQAHLKKYMVFFKTQMQASDLVSAGITGQDAQVVLASVFPSLPQSEFEQVIHNGHILMQLPHGAGYQLWMPQDRARELLTTLSSKCTLSSNASWNENLIRHGIGFVSSNTSEAFIPQMLNLSQNGGISFSKGCYTGQEIVARMQYLGKLKRHMYRLGLDAQHEVSAGDEVLTQGQTSPVGTVVNAICANGQQQALIVLEDKALPALGEGALFVGPKQVNAKELLSLPYDVIDGQPQ